MWPSLLSIYLPSVVMAFGQGMVIPTVPAIAEGFGVSPGLAAQMVTAQSLGRGAFLLPAGALVDRVGARRCMMAGPLIIAAAAAIAFITPTFALLLAAQFLTGVGGTVWQLGREISAIDVVPREQRGRLMAGFFGLSSIGWASGPVVGGAITDGPGFRWVFMIYVAVALVVATMAALMERPDVSSPAVPRAGFFQIGRLSEVHPYWRATFVVVVFGTFADHLFRMTLNSLLPLYVVTQRGFSVTEVGTLFGLHGLLSVALILPTGFISDKLGRRAISVPCAALLATSYVAYFFAGTFPLLVLATLVNGLGAGLSNGSKATYSYDVIPEQARGRLQALRRMTTEAAGLFGPMGAGLLVDLSSPGAAFLAFAPLQLVSALLFIFVARESLARRAVPG